MNQLQIGWLEGLEALESAVGIAELSLSTATKVLPRPQSTKVSLEIGPN